jgi:hypothetical protein
VPAADSLDSFISSLSNSASIPDSLQLDLSIAYLRKVHLYSFYEAKGCLTEGELMERPFHVRLKDADEALRQKQQKKAPAAEDGADEMVEDEGPLEYEDFLSKTHDDKVNESLQSLQESVAILQTEGRFVISPEADELAEATEAEIEVCREDWCAKHTREIPNPNADPLDPSTATRYRCGFHFCPKMFKNAAFLHKHLVNKHPEHFEAESAKVHDEYMKISWENAESRSFLPEVLIDCGTYGIKTSKVTGTFKVPEIRDPYPDLVRQEEEQARAHYEREEKRRREREGYDGAGSNQPDGRPIVTFIDVDDVKDETVEIKVDTAAVAELPNKPAKKKRKKNKLD